jgi:hypothetical protein
MGLHKMQAISTLIEKEKLLPQEGFFSVVSVSQFTEDSRNMSEMKCD